MPGEPVIETRNLTKFYGERRGVEDVNLRVEAGEVFGFLGPNGAGKTTTIRLLLDLLRPTRGSAHLFGLNAHKDNVAARARLGYLPGELALYEGLTGEQFLRHAGALRGATDLTLARDLARRFKLDLAKPMSALSKGNKQKVGIVQAFMHRPDLLVLDEPTSGLDPLMVSEFEDLVMEARRGGRTVFLSSHDLTEVERVCDRIAIIRDGRVVTVESIQTLKSRAARQVTVRFADPVTAEPFKRLPGVEDVLLVDSRRLTCTVTQVGFDGFVKAAAAHRVEDVTSREPSLEDVFRTYYGRET